MQEMFQTFNMATTDDCQSGAVDDEDNEAKEQASESESEQVNYRFNFHERTFLILQFYFSF